MQGAGYDVGSKCVRGGLSAAVVTVVCFGFGSYIQSVASTKSEASIDERVEHELETNRRNDEEERRCERLLTGERECISELNFTYNKHWDNCS